MSPEVGGLLSMMANTDRSTSCDNERIYPSDFCADRQKKETPPLDGRFKEGFFPWERVFIMGMRFWRSWLLQEPFEVVKRFFFKIY